MEIKDKTIIRFLNKIKFIDKDHCWEWSAHRCSAKDYGHFRLNGVLQKAHRAAYILANGEIKSGAYVAQTCQNHACVNPDHLKLSDRFTAQRMAVARRTHVSARKTHCPKGHEFTKENTRLYKNKRGRMARMCKICKDEKSRLYYYRDHELNKAKGREYRSKLTLQKRIRREIIKSGILPIGDQNRIQL